ncbi:MAG: hypothetical protein U0441_23675 [Polyangiaceae bacterium]
MPLHKRFSAQRAPRSARLLTSLIVATSLWFGVGCSSSGSATASGSSAAASGTATVEGPAAEATLFAKSSPILADLPVTKQIPKDVAVVIAVRDPATIVAKLSAMAAFGEAKEPLAKVIDEAGKDLSKDLPDLADLAASGVDLHKPAGVLWADPEMEVAAIFAAVSDEAAMKTKLQERADKSHGRRELVTVGDALVLQAKRDVTRAVVLRKGHVFWIRASEGYGLDPKRVVTLAEALAKTNEPESLAADPTFKGAMDKLAYGAEAAMYVGTGRIAERVLDDWKRKQESAQKGLEEANEALAEAQKKKKKDRIEEANDKLRIAKAAVATAEKRAKEADLVTALEDEVPAVAAGLDFGDRDVRVKAFVALPKPGAVKLFAPLEGTSPALDATTAHEMAMRFAMDPRVVSLFLDRMSASSRWWSYGVPMERGRGMLTSLGVDMEQLTPLFAGEVSAETHRQPLAADPDAGAPPDGKPREGEGYTVIWRVTDPAKATALIDEAWGRIADKTPAEAHREHPSPGAIDEQWPNQVGRHVRVIGGALVVTTEPAMLTAAADPAPRPLWLASSAHPTLKQLAGIDGAAGLVAFDGATWMRRMNRDMFGDGRTRVELLRDMEDFGMLGLLSGGGTRKTEKLEEERKKLRDKRRELEKLRAEHENATWRAFADRLGTTAFVAKPADGGVALYGGLFTSEASVTALAEAAIGAWMTAGPKWEKWSEMVDLDKKIHALDEKIEGERQKAMEDMVGDVLNGLGASDRPGGVLGGKWGGFDDDVSVLMGPNGGLGTHGGGVAGGGGTAVGVGGLGTIGTAEPKKKP